MTDKRAGLTQGEASPPVIHVVAAAVIRPDGRVLIAQRPAGKHLAGGWEFPGGKLEAGENRTQGLARELREELGIVIRDPRPLMRIRHRYPYGEVSLDMWVVTRYEGTPDGRDGQALRWLTQDELATAELLPADQPLVRALRLPECLLERESGHFVVETPGNGSGSPDSRLRGRLCSTGTEALQAGCSESGWEFLAMGCELTDGELRRLCNAVPIPVFAFNMELETAWARGASGINRIGFPVCL